MISNTEMIKGLGKEKKKNTTTSKTLPGYRNLNNSVENDTFRDLSSFPGNITVLNIAPSSSTLEVEKL